MTRKQITSLLLLGASIIYDVIPADLISDIPLVGWLDDMLVTSSAALNCPSSSVSMLMARSIDFSNGLNGYAFSLLSSLSSYSLLLQEP